MCFWLLQNVPQPHVLLIYGSLSLNETFITLVINFINAKNGSLAMSMWPFLELEIYWVLLSPYK
jgi:hypothetical protein